MRIRPWDYSRLCAAASEGFPLVQFAPSKAANSGSRPWDRSNRWRICGGDMLIAWSVTWQVEQQRPLVPRLWKKAPLGLLPLASIVCRNPLGSTQSVHSASCAPAAAGRTAASSTEAMYPKDRNLILWSPYAEGVA